MAWEGLAQQMAERSWREAGGVPQAGPGRARCFAGLVCAEIDTALIDTALIERPLPRCPAEPGLRCRYRLTEIGRLGLGLADIAAMLAEAASGTGHTALRRAALGARPAAGNGVVVARGRLTTDGLDSSGRQALAAGMQGHVVVVSGAGRLDRAAVHAAAMLGAERLTVVETAAARSPAEALRSTGLVRLAGPGEAGRLIAGADGVVLITPAGAPRTPVPGQTLVPAQTPVPGHPLRPGMWVAEIRTRPVGPGSVSHPGSTGAAPGGHGTLAPQTVGTFRLAAGDLVDADRAIRYLATLTGTVAGNAIAGDGRIGHAAAR